MGPTTRRVAVLGLLIVASPLQLNPKSADAAGIDPNKAFAHTTTNTIAAAGVVVLSLMIDDLSAGTQLCSKALWNMCLKLLIQILGGRREGEVVVHSGRSSVAFPERVIDRTPAQILLQLFRRFLGDLRAIEIQHFQRLERG
jgi:hypothetical protein